jgi:hypothetical protein
LYADLNCGHPRTRLLYITPELAAKGSFRKSLEKIYRNEELSRFVIDEGHCISEWGHDFRKDYRSLSYFRLVRFLFEVSDIGFPKSTYYGAHCYCYGEVRVPF